MSVPWVDHRDAALLEVLHVACRQFSSARAGDGGDLGICLRNRLAGPATPGGQGSELLRRLGIEGQNAPAKINLKSGSGGLHQPVMSFSIRRQRHAIKNFRLGDRGHKHRGDGQGVDPGHDSWIRR